MCFLHKRKWVQHSCILLQLQVSQNKVNLISSGSRLGKPLLQTPLCELNREPGDFRYNQCSKLFNRTMGRWKTQCFFSRTSYSSMKDVYCSNDLYSCFQRFHKPEICSCCWKYWLFGCFVFSHLTGRIPVTLLVTPLCLWQTGDNSTV